MNPSSFEYFSPRSIDEALDLLSKYEDEIKILAGGQSLVPLLKSRFVAIPYIMDISRIEGMNHIKETGNGVSIGALATVSEIEEHPAFSGSLLLLREAARQIADPLIRNRGTVGGNISHGDPANDLPAVMLALNAVFVVIGPDGEREIEAKHFFIDTFETALEPNEILKEIWIKRDQKRSGSTYLKLKKGAGDFSVAAVAVHLALDDDLKFSDVGIGLTAVAPIAVKAEKAEKFIEGKKFSASLLEKASEIAVGATDPVSDFYGSAEYKSRVLKMLVKDAISKSYDRAVQQK